MLLKLGGENAGIKRRKIERILRVNTLQKIVTMSKFQGVSLSRTLGFTASKVSGLYQPSAAPRMGNVQGEPSAVRV